jgi:uncharacterized protein YqhQ
VREKPIISGISLPFGIQFDGRAHSLYVERTGMYKLTTRRDRESKLYKIVKKIPFVRGFYFLFSTVYHFAHGLLKENLAMFILLAGIAAYSAFGPTFASSRPSAGFFWDNFLNFVLIAVMFAFVYGARKHHSIEHKLIATYQKGIEPTLANVKEQPSHNSRCGGVLFSYIIIAYPLLKYFTLLEGFTLTLVLIIIGYEGLVLANMDNALSKVFYFPGYLIQKLTTTNNLTDYDIDVFRKPFKKFIDLEREYIAEHSSVRVGVS